MAERLDGLDALGAATTKAWLTKTRFIKIRSIKTRL
jgi:hypothetical protein